jgi:prepilin peptidase CpaA
MDQKIIALGLMGLLALLMIAAAVSDLRSRTISNGLNATIALFAIPFWIVSGMAFWPDMPMQFGAAFAVFAVFAGLFALGAMGGGDVKMIGAVMLWIPLYLYFPMLTIMAIGGGILSAVMLIQSKIVLRTKRERFPTGLRSPSGAFGGFTNTILTSFSLSDRPEGKHPRVRWV